MSNLFNEDGERINQDKAHIVQDNLVKDSNGMYWSFGNQNIICVGDETENGGEYCNSFLDGIILLIEDGYIEIEEIESDPLYLEMRKND